MSQFGSDNSEHEPEPPEPVVDKRGTQPQSVANSDDEDKNSSDGGGWQVVRKKDKYRHNEDRVYRRALTHGLIPNDGSADRRQYPMQPASCQPQQHMNDSIACRSYGVRDAKDLDECRRQFANIVASTRTFRHVATENPRPSWDPNDVQSTQSSAMSAARMSSTGGGGFGRAVNVECRPSVIAKTATLDNDTRNPFARVSSAGSTPATPGKFGDRITITDFRPSFIDQTTPAFEQPTRGGFARSAAPSDDSTPTGHTRGGFSRRATPAEGDQPRRGAFGNSQSVDIDHHEIFKASGSSGRTRGSNGRMNRIDEDNEEDLDGFRPNPSFLMQSGNVGPSYAEIWQNVVDYYDTHSVYEIDRSSDKPCRLFDARHAQLRVVKDPMLVMKAAHMHARRMPPGSLIAPQFRIQQCMYNENLHFSMHIHGARALLERFARGLAEAQIGTRLAPLGHDNTKIKPLNYYHKCDPINFDDLPSHVRTRLIHELNFSKRYNNQKNLRSMEYDAEMSMFVNELDDTVSKESFNGKMLRTEEFVADKDLAYFKGMLDVMNSRVEEIEDYQQSFVTPLPIESPIGLTSSRLCRITNATKRRRAMLFLPSNSLSLTTSPAGIKLFCEARASVDLPKSPVTYPQARQLDVSELEKVENPAPSSRKRSRAVLKIVDDDEEDAQRVRKPVALQVTRPGNRHDRLMLPKKVSRELHDRIVAQRRLMVETEAKKPEDKVIVAAGDEQPEQEDEDEDVDDERYCQQMVQRVIDYRSTNGLPPVDEGLVRKIVERAFYEDQNGQDTSTQRTDSENENDNCSNNESVVEEDEKQRDFDPLVGGIDPAAGDQAKPMPPGTNEAFHDPLKPSEPQLNDSESEAPPAPSIPKLEPVVCGLNVKNLYYVVEKCKSDGIVPFIDLSALLPQVVYRPFDAFDGVANRLTTSQSLNKLECAADFLPSCNDDENANVDLPAHPLRRVQSHIQLTAHNWNEIENATRRYRYSAKGAPPYFDVIQKLYNSFRFSSFSYRQCAKREHRSYRQCVKREHRPNFFPFLSPILAMRGVNERKFVTGILRINPRNMEEAFVIDDKTGAEYDFVVYGSRFRNRALDGDFVVVRLRDKLDWMINENVYQVWRTGRRRGATDESLTAAFNKAREIVLDRNDPLAFIRDDDIRKDIRRNIRKVIPVFVKNDGLLERYTRREMYHIGAQCMHFCQQLNDALATAEDRVVLPPYERRLLNPIDQPDMFRAMGVYCDDGSLVSPRSGNRDYIPLRPISQQCRFKQVKRMMYPRYFRGMHRAEDIPDCCLRKTAEVILIAEHFNSGLGVGRCEAFNRRPQPNGIFKPLDVRVPRQILLSSQLPADFKYRENEFKNILLLVKLNRWHVQSRFPRGDVIKQIGPSGLLRSEVLGLVEMLGIDSGPFSTVTVSDANAIVTRDYMNLLNGQRFDLRSLPTFAVDNGDDEHSLALSVVKTHVQGVARFKVYVHVPDVAFYVDAGSTINAEAQERCCAVNAQDLVFPMLPSELTQDVLSFTPEQDRPTVTMSYTLDGDGNIVEYHIHRSVIRTTAAVSLNVLAALVSQSVLPPHMCPPNVDYSLVESLRGQVTLLFNLARTLRRRRISSKPSFIVGRSRVIFKGATTVGDSKRDSQSKLELNPKVVSAGFVNFNVLDMIDELQFTANSVAAQTVKDEHEHLLILRRSCAPHPRAVFELNAVLQSLGLPAFDPATDSAAAYVEEHASKTRAVALPVAVLLNYLLSKIQTPNRYITTNDIKDDIDYEHFNLGEKVYMRFTAPTRRYADLFAQRILLAATGYSDFIEMDPEEVSTIASKCWKREEEVSRFSDELTQLYFLYFVRTRGSFDAAAVVVNIGEAWMDVFLLKYNVVERCYLTVAELSTARTPTIILQPVRAAVIHWDAGGVNRCRRIRLRGNRFVTETDSPSSGTASEQSASNAKVNDVTQLIHIGSVVRVFVETELACTKVRVRLMASTAMDEPAFKELEAAFKAGDIGNTLCNLDCTFSID